MLNVQLWYAGVLLRVLHYDSALRGWTECRLPTAADYARWARDCA